MICHCASGNNYTNTHNFAINRIRWILYAVDPEATTNNSNSNSNEVIGGQLAKVDHWTRSHASSVDSVATMRIRFDDDESHLPITNALL
jgi:hypothetical protein